MASSSEYRTMKPFVEYGCSRAVLLIGRYAFKFPTMIYSWSNFLNGLLHNMEESAFSKMRIDYLCPVLYSLPGGFMNVMPRCKILTKDEYNSLKIRKKFERSVMSIEEKPDSYGWYQGRVVAVDYGD